MVQSGSTCRKKQQFGFPLLKVKQNGFASMDFGPKVMKHRKRKRQRFIERWIRRVHRSASSRIRDDVTVH